jgi:hypothetical protein
MTRGSIPNWRATLARWLRESSADTRDPGGPEARVYEVPFAEVWDEVVGEVERRPRWTLSHRDEELGLISVTCRSPVPRLIDDLTVWISLDEDGLTRVELLSKSRNGRGDFGVNRRRIEGLLRHLDHAVGSDHRVLRRGRPPSGSAPGVDRGIG